MKLDHINAPEALDREKLTTLTAALVERVNLLSDRGDLDTERDTIKKMVDDVTALSERITKAEKAFNDAHRTLDADGDNPFNGFGGVINRMEPPKGMNRTHYNLLALSPDEFSYVAPVGNVVGLSKEYVALSRKYGLNDAWRSKLVELHALNDAIILTDLLLYGTGDTQYAHSGESRGQRIKGLKLWRDWSKLADEFKKRTDTALDTQTADHGQEWVPTMWSNQLIQLIQAELVVAPLFTRLTMPAPTYHFPIMGADNIAYYVGEGTEEGATAITSKNFVTNDATLTAKKLATRMMASSEITEDSVVNIAPLMASQIAKAIARAIDDALVNGDTTGSHQDSDVTASDDRRKAWKGLRYYGLAGTAKAALGATVITAEDLLGIKGLMGSYGSRPTQGAWITSFSGLIKLMLAKYGGDSSPMFLTADKYGAGAAPNLTGELGRIAGSPVVVSEFMREDLNASGVYDNVTKTNTGVLYVNRESFIVGERRALTVNRSDQRYIETDQIVFVGTWRGDFQPFYTGANAVGFLYDVQP